MNRIDRTKAMAAGAGALLLAAGLGGGYWLARGDADSSGAGASATVAGSGGGTDASGREVLYWYDPMVPDQHFDKPGKSPFMDMELVPKYADEVSATGVRIDPGVQQNLGMRTAPVEVGTLGGQVSVPGTRTWDLRNEEVVSAPVQAIISRLNIRAPYERVGTGTPLATVLAPEWGAAIAETRALAQADSAYARELRGASQQRLRMLGLSGNTAAGNGSVVLRSPRSGVVSELMAREGQTVMPGMPLFRINGTSTLWLEAAIPQGMTDDIRPGTQVAATVNAIPGRTFDGRVETLLPEVDEATRTQRARIVLRNEDDLLAPGMFAEVALQPEGRKAVPLVPSEALITTGTDTRVLVVGEDGNFQPVRVRTGRSAGGRTEVLAGLEGGERVVTSGQFLIDSEASLSGALKRLGPPADAAADDVPASSVPAAEGPAATPGNDAETGMNKEMDMQPAPTTGDNQ
jgi:Cu(I)/Ag(I) efflux system membrane fusion protein